MTAHFNNGRINPLMGTLKPWNSRPLYSNTVISRTVAVDGWLLHLVQQGGAWAGCGPAQSPPRYSKCNIPPINGQCTNFILFDVAL